MERDVIVSAYQGKCAEGDFAANVAVVRAVVKEARARGSHFVCFPECFLSGCESADAVRNGARNLEDPDLAAFIAESAQHEMVLLVGIARKAPDGLYSAELVIHRGKLMGYYDKVMLSKHAGKSLGFSPGKSVPLFQAHGVRFALHFGADSSFPFVALHGKLQGAEMLFSPHNGESVAGGADDHRAWIRGNHVGTACRMNLAVIRANLLTPARPGQTAPGDSFILSPQGTLLAEAEPLREGLITAAITPAMFRSGWAWTDFSETPAWLRRQLAELLTESRQPTDDADLAYWLENMTVHHGLSREEIGAATGLACTEIDAAMQRLGVADRTAIARKPDAPLMVLPYPGGRHPRIGNLKALMPQRETKVSVFTPWEGGGYVVVDVPEAVWSNLGLLYLAHTHVPTIWDRAGIKLPRLEWTRNSDGTLEVSRTLPNGVAFGTKVSPAPADVFIDLWLRNGTNERLTDLRVQNCVMLAAATGFAAQTNDNKLFQPPFAAARSDDGRRWIVAAFEPVQRLWGNELCPCIHSDPQFPDCDPGETVRIRGRVWFYEGLDIDGELRRAGAAGR